MKGNHSEPKRYALTILEDRQICTAVQISKLQAVAIQQIAMIKTMERDAALRALLVGLTLHRIKGGLKHGEFTPWIKKHLDGAGYRQGNYYMRLATAFVDCMNVTKPEILAFPGDQKELALELADATARKFMQKAANFVGERSLNELLDHLHIKDRNPLGGARPAKKDNRSEEAKLAELREVKRAELASWITTGRALLIDENVCQFLPRGEIEAIHGQLLDLKTEFTKAIQPLLRKAKA